MNQGRIWCVVHPTVGLPLLLGSVTLISLTVHGTVLSNTTWMADYFKGSQATTTALAKPAASSLANASPRDVVRAAPMQTSALAVSARTAPARVVDDVPAKGQL